MYVNKLLCETDSVYTSGWQAYLTIFTTEIYAPPNPGTRVFTVASFVISKKTF